VYEGLEIITVPTWNLHSAVNGAIKSLNYLNNVLAKIEANNAGCEEAIMLNAEATSPSAGDIVHRQGQQLYTPPLYASASTASRDRDRTGARAGFPSRTQPHPL
jgi:branched-chain amino acid aminotransferase